MVWYHTVCFTLLISTDKYGTMDVTASVLRSEKLIGQ